MKSTALMLAVALFSAQTCTFAQQESPRPSSRVTDDMVSADPALMNAAGRRRDQLQALLALDSDKMNDEAQKQHVAQFFDLSSTGDSLVVDELLRDEGDAGIQSKLCIIFAMRAPQSVGWLLDRYGDASSTVRSRIIQACWGLEFKEVYELLVKALGDKTLIPNKRARALAPPGYSDMRVCDRAYSALVHKIAGSGGTPPGHPASGAISPMHAVPWRDGRIAALQAYLSDRKDGEWARILSGKPSAFPR